MGVLQSLKCGNRCFRDIVCKDVMPLPRGGIILTGTIAQVKRPNCYPELHLFCIHAVIIRGKSPFVKGKNVAVLSL